MKTTIVKIGTESLTNFESSIKVQNMVEDISRLVKQKTKVLLVTSGAVAEGRRIRSDITDKSILSWIGWHVLMSQYDAMFAKNQISVCWGLVRHADIEDCTEKASRFKQSVESCWSSWILPIINENDFLSQEELDRLARWADNDQNALLLAKTFQANALCIITNTNGVYSDPYDHATRIASIASQELTSDNINKLCQGKSGSGTGGMASKLRVAHEAGKFGIETHITNGIDSRISNMTTGGTTIFANPQ